MLESPAFRHGECVKHTPHKVVAKSAETTPEAPEETPNNADVDEHNDGEADNA